MPLFFGQLKSGQEIGGREKGKDMRQRTTGGIESGSAAMRT